MKRYFKYIMMALAAVVFIGTFVFLYIKSQPKPVEYNEFEPKLMDIRKTTVVTGKTSSPRFQASSRRFSRRQDRRWKPER